MATENSASQSALTFEQGLRHYFREIEDIDPFLLLALADAGGFAEQKIDWLQQTANGRLLSLGPYGERSVGELLSVWTRVRAGAPDEVFNAITGFVLDPSDSINLVLNLIKPLALVGRIALIPYLVRRLLAAGRAAVRPHGRSFSRGG